MKKRRIVLTALLLLVLSENARSETPPTSSGLKEDDPDGSCIVPLGEGVFRLHSENADNPCLFSVPPYGVLINLQEGEMEVSPLRGHLITGVARLHTGGAPFEIEGHRHIVLPKSCVELKVIPELTTIYSKEGETSVFNCKKLQFALLPGERLALKNDGSVYYHQNSEGGEAYYNPTAQVMPPSCAFSSTSQPFAGKFMVLMMLIAMGMLQIRRRKKAH